MGGGGGWWEGYQVSTNGTRCPSEMVNSATVLRSSPVVATGVVIVSASGPATIPVLRWSLVTHGTTLP